LPTTLELFDLPAPKRFAKHIQPLHAHFPHLQNLLYPQYKTASRFQECKENQLPKKLALPLDRAQTAHNDVQFWHIRHPVLSF